MMQMAQALPFNPKEVLALCVSWLLTLVFTR